MSKLFAGVDAHVKQSGGGYGLIDVEAFTSDGTWNRPVGTVAIEIEAIAGGGGGGGATAPTTAGRINMGGAGGGGNYAYRFYKSPAASYSITVGQGGNGGNSSGGNGVGGTDSVIGSSLLRASAGDKGSGSTSGTGGNGTNGGEGGIPGNEDFEFFGHHGEEGFVAANGGGVNAKLPHRAGQAGIGYTRTKTEFSTLANLSGGSEAGYGTGGNGGFAANGGSNAAGGAGDDGIVIIKSYGYIT